MSNDESGGRGRGPSRRGRGGGGGRGRSSEGSTGRSGGRGGRGRGRGRGRGGDTNTNTNTNTDHQTPARGGGRSGRNDRDGGGRHSQNYNGSSSGGGGGGGGRYPNTNGGGGAYNNNNHNQTNQNNKPKAPVLKNGEKGAEVHTVSESERIQFTKMLMDLRESETATQMEMPSTLTNTERKFIHQLAGQLGLVSKSTGKGETRRIIITKRKELKKAAGEEEDLPMLRVGKDGMKALQQHVKKHPPTHPEALESYETGASLVEAYSSYSNSANAPGGGSGDDTALVATLDSLGLGVSQKAAPIHRHTRHVNLDKRINYHQARQQQKLKSPHYSQMVQIRQRLPAAAHEAQIVATVAKSPVTIIQGETGCGKSTQVPQFLLDANPTASIVVTQPRRISAISIAERVAQEQCLNDGANGMGAGLIGYQVRLESAVTKDTQLVFLTPGILLRKLQSSPTLAEFTHIIIDEIHERDRYTEFLLITLRDLLPRRPDLRLILMSATLQTEALVGYFGGYNHSFYEQHPPSIIEMQGRTFPVQEFFLEDVLTMTGYIDAVPSTEDTNLTMDDLEKELAKLMATTDAASTITVDASSSLVCAMCGQTGFSNPAELGSHVAMCDGVAPQRQTASKKLETIESMNDDDENDDDDGGDEINMDAFDDYDVDGVAEVEGYDLLDVQDVQAQEMVESSSTRVKWDGESPYDVSNDDADMKGLTLTEEQLLDQYQMMHDDNQVDTSLLLEVLLHIIKSSSGDGAILVFLPGWMEISEFSMMLESTLPFRDRSKYLVLPLHSGIPSRDQRKVLQRPPSGMRKIVLSTNIAETSLTIEDVSFVVDTGRAKEKNYDPHLKTSTLQPTWISQASSKQRKGRAGRTKAGVCFHLFSSRRHSSFRPFVESELLRTPLEEMCLMAKKLELAPGGPEDDDGVPAFLAKAMSPPHAKSISNALELLVDLGAMLPETNDLTILGLCLSILSLEPRVGKMVIWSYLLGCAKVSSSMAVAMSYKSPFILPPPSMRRDAEKAQVQLSQNSESDQVTVLNAILKRDQLVKRSAGDTFNDFCRKSFLSSATVQMISDLRKNISRELTTLGFPNPATMNQYHNRHDTSLALWQAAIAAGLYPNVASRKRGDVNFSTMTNRKAKIHVSSVNSVKGQPMNSKCQVPEGEVEFVCFGEMVKGTHFFTMSQTTHLASPLPLLLLCGTSLSVRPLPNIDDDDKSKSKFAILNMDDWIIFKCEADVAAQLVILRKRLDAAFWHALADPGAGVKNLTATERDAVEILGTVLQSAHKSTAAR